MVQRGLKVLCAFALVLSLATQSLAQTNVSQPAGAGAETKERSAASGGPRRQLATIIFAGLGGAVLGLSTLSFYGRPQEKLANIAIGFAFGIIAGTALVTYKAATSPAEFYGAGLPLEESRPVEHEARPWIEIEKTRQSAGAPDSMRSPVALSFSHSF